MYILYSVWVMCGYVHDYMYIYYTCNIACVNCNNIIVLTVVLVQGANQNAASASVISPAGQQRLANGSEVLSPTSTLHTHGGGSPEMREITV